MAIRLRRPDQPLYQQILLGIFEFLASLRLAVVLLSLGAAVLAWATFSIERNWGTPATHFAVYGSWWFALLLGLLAVNVFASAAIRFPWKRYQTGFVLIHSGILVLLLGALLSKMYGVGGQLWVVEGRRSNRAYEERKIIRLAVTDRATDSASDENERSQESDKNERSQETVIDIPFRCGPFSWCDYSKMAVFPWRLASLDRGVLYDKDGIKVEALDYYADSRVQAVPRLVLDVTEESADAPGLAEEGTTSEITLDVHWPRQAAMVDRQYGIGSRERLRSGRRVVFWMTGSPRETEAFLKSAPEQPLGKKGVLVLFAGGKRTVVSLDDLTPGDNIRIEGTDLRAEFRSWDPSMLAVELAIHSEKPRVEEMLLFADFPELNRQDYVNGLFGTYWFDPKSDAPEVDERMRARVAAPRLDILQTREKTLVYRAWSNGTVEEIAPVAEDARIVAFEKSDRPLVARIAEFIPSELPSQRIRPLPFDLEKRVPQSRVLLQVTVDGQTRKKWTLAAGFNPVSDQATADETLSVRDGERTVSATFRPAELDLGFAVRLKAFNFRYDPGTTRASHYSSLVDIVDPKDPGDVYEKDVLIDMNYPADVRDPKTGRVYRLFQSSYRGPWRPDNPEFRELAGDDLSRDRIYMSVLSVNYDPGRGVMYAGSLLIVLGIGIAFYMKAYFFKPMARPIPRGEKAAEDATGCPDASREAPLPGENPSGETPPGEIQSRETE